MSEKLQTDQSSTYAINTEHTDSHNTEKFKLPMKHSS
jgi:hypothetical protein